MAVSQYDKQNLTSGQQAEIDRVTKAAQAGQMSWSDAHTAAEAVRASGGYSGGSTGAAYSPYDTTTATAASNSSNSVNTSDLSSYLKNLYAAQTEANISSLNSAYNTNKANLEAEGAKIAPTYQTQKNQAAAQSDLSKQSFNEVAAANGLNSGTTGQASLAQGVALQNNLNTLSAAQANAESANALSLSNLASEYQNAITKAQADGNTSLASALYNEYTRQAQASATEAQNAQEQANWNKEYGLSEKQYQLSVDQNAASQASANKEYSYKTAMEMISNGVLPSTSLLTASGISAVDAQNMVATVKAQAAAQASTKTKSSGGNSKSSGRGSSGSGKTLTAAQSANAVKSGTITTSTLSSYDGHYGSGAYYQYLVNQNNRVSDMLTRVNKENFSAARKLAQLQSYYNAGYYNAATYAYLASYLGLVK